MDDFNRFLDAFINGDTFIIFIVIMLMILLVLILALFKTKNEYNELSIKEKKVEENSINKAVENNTTNNTTIENKTIIEEKKEDPLNFDYLKAETEEDKFDENKPLIKQVDIPSIQTYNDIIEIYENNEEENAVISAEELERKKQERMNELGVTDNQSIIQKYEEEQEKKAIISYEQLLKNASNITLSYKEEEPNKNGAPKVNKIEVEKKEVTPAENFVDEEEFLKILKEFRLTL